MSETALSVKHLQKSYRDLAVLKDVSFEVEKGSVFALLGSNGAGKTTVVRLLSTLLRPDGGSALVNGYDVVREADGVRRSISLTGQFAAVDEILTGRENLQMIGRLYHLGKRVSLQRADELLERFALTDAANRPVKG